MTTQPDNRSFEILKQLRLAIAIVVEDDSTNFNKTIENTAFLSENVFVLGLDPSEQTTNTVQMNGLTERFVSVSFCKDRSEARNRLVKQIEKESEANWLLWLRAGESFDLATLDEFAAFFENEADFDSLYVQILRRYIKEDGSRHDLDEETIDARLMPLRKGLCFTGYVNESLFTSANQLMIQLSASPGRIVCPTRFLEPSAKIIRGARNLKLIESLAAQNVAFEDDLLMFRAETRVELNDLIGARKDYFNIIEKCSKTNLRLEAFYRIWETMMLVPTPPNEVTQFLLQALDHFPVDMQLLTFMGRHLQNTGQLDMAKRTYDTAIRYGQISLDVWHRLHIREIAVVSLAMLCNLQGNSTEAIRILEDNLDSIDNPVEYVRFMFDFYIRDFQDSKAHEVAERVWKGEQLATMQSILTGACYASAGSYETAVSILHETFEDGCRDLICLRWYSLCLLALCRFQDAIPVLKEWAAADPQNTEVKAYLKAARTPDRFGKIVAQMRDVNRAALGQVMQNFDNKPKKSVIEDAVREMISASGRQSHPPCCCQSKTARTAKPAIIDEDNNGKESSPLLKFEINNEDSSDCLVQN